MSNKRQQLNQQNQQAKPIEEEKPSLDEDTLLKEALARRAQQDAALNTEEEIPSFMQEAAVADVSDTTTPETTPTQSFEYQDLPNHIEEAKIESAPSQVVNLEQLSTEISSGAISILQTIFRYMEDMAVGKPLQPKEGARYQAQLWGALKAMCFNLDDREFNIVYENVLKLFYEHREGVFSQDAVYRFPEEWPMSSAEHAAFAHLLTLMLNTCDRKTRYQVSRKLNWSYVFEIYYPEGVQNRIRSFYDL
nr:MAG TPA: hypothetical protein [Caudoviricetes sp.]